MLTSFADLPEEVPIIPYTDIPVEEEESDSSVSFSLTNLSDTEELKSPATDLQPMPMASPQRQGWAKGPEASDSKSLTSLRSHDAGSVVDEDGQVPPKKHSRPIEMSTDEDSSSHEGLDCSPPRSPAQRQFKKQKPSAIHTPSPGTYILGDDSSPARKRELTPKRNGTEQTSDLIDTDREDSDDDDDDNDSGFLEAQEHASQATWQVNTNVELSEHQSVLDEGLAATRSVNTRSAVSTQVRWPTEEELEGLSSGEIFDVEMAYLDKRLRDKEQTEDGALLMSEGAPGTTDLVEQPGRLEMDLVEDLPEEVPIIPYTDIPVEEEESDSSASSSLTNLSDTEELKSPATDLRPMPMASPRRQGRAKDPEVSDSESLTSLRSRDVGSVVDEDGQVPLKKRSHPIEMSTDEDSSSHEGLDRSPPCSPAQRWFKKQKPSAICTPSPGTYILGDDNTDREDSDDDDDDNDSGFLEAQEHASQATWQVNTDVELSEHQSVLDEGLAATQSVNTRSAVSVQELEGLSSGEIFDVEMAYLDKRLCDKEQTEDGALLMSKGAPGTTDLVEQPGRLEMDLVEGELGDVFLCFINGEAFSQGSTDEGAARGSEHPPPIRKRALDTSGGDGDLMLKRARVQTLSDTTDLSELINETSHSLVALTGPSLVALTGASLAPDLLKQIITGDEKGVVIVSDDTEQPPEHRQVGDGTHPMPEVPTGVSNGASKDVIEVSDEDEEPKLESPEDLLQWQENMKKGLQSYLKDHQPLAAIQLTMRFVTGE
ncbi:hypothetical protein ARMGADRAFT_1037096 [Armillaria gallica]|uniref:Uncharacterized protein n=1 Tax=Armillaria gallica TaxID=47427 RepID=A0A2H3D7Q1_ARMGA|nr:hypothetical protein ARMGADRAFT_1037096 [Armillaria gallica]